ncbi:MAG: cation transporter, partial [Candidatus Rokubacteria bacterium]|nr:cation transporter [Candidatus Rokubacteria bacterium]
MQKVTLIVPSIHSEGCVAVIKDTLVKLPGVVAAEGDPQTKQVIVTARNGQGQRQAIQEAIT